MKAGKVLTMKAVALGVAVMFIAASCGSSSSSSGGKTKNSALCFATQEDKDAAIATAQADLDAANGTDTTGATGGYRRPAIRVMTETTVPPTSTIPSSSTTANPSPTTTTAPSESTVPSDSTVPASDSTVPTESTVVDSGPNIPMLEQALADAQSQPLCDAVDASSDSTTPGGASGCTATFTSTGVSWDCPNGELFNAAIEDMSNPGVYPFIGCASSGSFTVAEGQQFWFNFYLVNGPGTFIDGWNTDRELNVPIGFTVPEDTEGVCAQSASDAPKDYSTLAYSTGSFTPARTQTWYTFVLTEDTQVAVTLNGIDCANGGNVEIYSGTSTEDLSRTGTGGYNNLIIDGNCTGAVVDALLPAGNYVVLVTTYRNEAPITVNSSIELTKMMFEAVVLPKTQNSFTYEFQAHKYFTLTETTDVVITTSSERNDVNNWWNWDNCAWSWFSLSDAKHTQLANVSADINYAETGPCSSAIMKMTLEAGTYYLDFEGSGLDSINAGSSIELLDANSFKWDFTTETVTPDQSFEVVVPKGGAWFRAEGNSKNDFSVTIDKDGNWIAAAGCASMEVEWTCDNVNPLVLILDSNGDLVHSDDNSGMVIGSTIGADKSAEISATNWLGASMSTFLEEGTYTLVATKGWWDENQEAIQYELRYGFQSAGKIIVKPIDDVVLPDIPVDPQVPFSSLTSDGSAQVSVSSEVDTMVCDGACIDALFAQAELTDGYLTVSAGNSSTRIFKGQRLAMIPLAKNATNIRVVGKSADGSKTPTLSVKLNHADAAMEKAMKDKVATGAFQTASESTTSTSGSSTSIYIYVLIALLILVAIGYMRRKKATETK